MQKQALMECSQAELINYVAIGLAEIFVIDPNQNKIDVVKRLLQEYQTVISKYQ